MTKKIYYHDTDLEGVVYYANYLKYFEEARTEQLLSVGIDLRRLSEKGILFAVTNVEIKYKRPARYGDLLVIESTIEKVKAASMQFMHRITGGGATLVECSTRLVSLGRNFKPIALPEDIVKRLSDESLTRKSQDI